MCDSGGQGIPKSMEMDGEGDLADEFIEIGDNGSIRRYGASGHISGP